MEVIRDGLWLCADCTLAAVNGDTSGVDSDERVREIEEGLNALGSFLVTDDDGEGVEEFSRTECDCCGTTLAGSRYRFAILGPTPAGKVPRGEVKFSLQAEQDDSSVRGNLLASGNDAVDKEEEDAVLARLDRGEVWAWACVTVTATWRGLQGHAYLGGCSYESEIEFVEGGYYDDLQQGAYDDLQQRVDEALVESDELRSALGF